MAPKLPGKWPYFSSDLKDEAISGNVQVCLLEDKMATKKAALRLKVLGLGCLAGHFFQGGLAGRLCQTRILQLVFCPLERRFLLE